MQSGHPMTIIPKHKGSPPNVELFRVSRQITTGYTSVDVCMYVYPTATRFIPSRLLIPSLSIEFVP